jgi:hypothetical protein
MSPSFFFVTSASTLRVIVPAIFVGWFFNHYAGSIFRNIVRLLVYNPRGSYTNTGNRNAEMHTGVYIYLGI